MWFGTRDGLNRFDGYKFKVFKNDPGNRFALSNNFVTDILEARTGALLIVTRSGLNRFNRDKNEFTRYNLEGFVLNAIFQDRLGNIWLGTSKGLCLINLENGKCKFFKTNYKNSIGSNVVIKIAEDLEGNLWLATSGGLNWFTYKTNQMVHYLGDPKSGNSIAGNDLRVIYSDKFGNIWIGTYGDGLCLYDKNCHDLARANTHYTKRVKEFLKQDDL
ncbi:ligand-binding sensor domain-containing protein [Flavobacterium sp. ZS1P14]|uniref:ligand-binding sensor domain-containing protein n=1 Tax=Flavobacterium sp. ZS1P14 TaxID=3401729 RepID=UPI003AB01EC1